MNEKDALIVMFVVLVVAVIMLKKPDDDDENDSTKNMQIDILMNLKMGEYVNGRVTKYGAASIRDSAGALFLDTDDQVRITKQVDTDGSDFYTITEYNVEPRLGLMNQDFIQNPYDVVREITLDKPIPPTPSTP